MSTCSYYIASFPGLTFTCGKRLVKRLTSYTDRTFFVCLSSHAKCEPVKPKRELSPPNGCVQASSVLEVVGDRVACMGRYFSIAKT